MKKWCFQTKISYKKTGRTKKKRKKTKRSNECGCIAAGWHQALGKSVWRHSQHLLLMSKQTRPSTGPPVLSASLGRCLHAAINFQRKRDFICRHFALCLEKNCRLQQAKAHIDTHTRIPTYIYKCVYTWSSAIKFFCIYCKQTTVSGFA